ncbi:NAD-P-binding protein [Lactarius hengduanensis]|nr:NAD-P-binding protein [Lactarius hengduanensis]
MCIVSYSTYTLRSVYSTIDPKEAFANQTYGGKVVLITGASRGIGQETAITYAKAGANVTITGLPGAQILPFRADVRDPKATEAAVKATLKRFGRLDVVIANAELDSKDPDLWWNTFEVNIRGTFNTVRPSLLALEKTCGRIVVVSSDGAQLRIRNASDYVTSKHALNRLVEFIALAATMLYLTSGRIDWLNGKYLAANWDISEIERTGRRRYKQGDRGGVLINKLAIPK